MVDLAVFLANGEKSQEISNISDALLHLGVWGEHFFPNWLLIINNLCDIMWSYIAKPTQYVPQN